MRAWQPPAFSLELDEHVGAAGLDEPAQPHDGRAADRMEDRFGNPFRNHV